MSIHPRRWICLLHVSVMVVAGGLMVLGSPDAHAEDDHYWDLGVGLYDSRGGELDTRTGASMTYLDAARADWVHHKTNLNREGTEMLNRLMSINPDLKVVVRIWPINGLGLPENRRMATMWDYFYKPGTREAVFERIERQVGAVMDHIDKPENVVGFTFLEELPLHWTRREMDIVDESTIPPYMERYRDEIEAERGKPLERWDDDWRVWWGEKLVESLNEVHAHIKEVSGGKRVFVWFQANHRTLDWVDDPSRLNRQRLLPLYWEDVIKSGVADGFFAYPNSEFVWSRYLEMAEEHGWVFFSQLSQPSGMRLHDWPTTLEMVERDSPYNLGYFIYTSGNDRTGHWNDNPAIPWTDNVRRQSTRRNIRRHMADRAVGMDIVRRELAPEIEVTTDMRDPSDHVVPLGVWVRNVRDESWFNSSDEAALESLQVTLEMPDGFYLDPAVSAGPTVEINRIEQREGTYVLYWVSRENGAKPTPDEPLTVRITGEDFEPIEHVIDGPTSRITEPEHHEARRSGDVFYHPLFRIEGHPGDTIVELECIESHATQPSVELGGNRLIYLGTLTEGQRLVIGPGREARLFENEEDDEGRDVSHQIGGRPLQLERNRTNRFTYRDIDPRLHEPRVRIRFEYEIE